MASAFKKGDPVRQITPAPVVGTVAAFSVDQETGDVQYLVEWMDADGATQSRYFNDEQLEAAPVATE